MKASSWKIFGWTTKCKFYCNIIDFCKYEMEWQKHCCQCLTNKSLHSSIAIYVLWSNYQQWWRTTSNLGFCSAWVTLSDYLSAAATVCPWVKSCLKLHLKLPYSGEFKRESLIRKSTFCQKVTVHEHGLRTPNEGINQRYLKNWADGRQNMLPPYLKIWDWDWVLGRAVKAISSVGVRSPCYRRTKHYLDQTTCLKVLAQHRFLVCRLT